MPGIQIAQNHHAMLQVGLKNYSHIYNFLLLSFYLCVDHVCIRTHCMKVLYSLIVSSNCLTLDVKSLTSRHVRKKAFYYIKVNIKLLIIL